jgi:hypothetical protein
LARGEKRAEKLWAFGRYRSDWAMKLFTGWMISAGLVLSAAAANAQGVAPYPSGSSRSTVVSDFGGPYAGTPPEAAMPGYGPPLLPPQEVYAIVRENGFSPLGIPRQRGFIYTISVIHRGGDDGRLVIDARTGRIIRFMPAYRMGDNFNEEMMPPYGRPTYGPPGPPPPISNMRGEPRPPVSVPRMASRTPQVPLPKAAPPRAAEVKPPAAAPAPAPVQQSAAVQVKPADTPTPPPAASPPIVEAKPAAPPIQPTQAMPNAQGLD